MSKFQTIRRIISLFAICSLASIFAPLPGANGYDLILNPSDVIGGSGSYGGTFNSGQFNATQILDAQTGIVTEPSQNGYWLNPDGGPANAYITVNLGSPWIVNQLELFNTSNANYQDRGTGNFTIIGGNAVTDTGGGNYALTGPTTLLTSGTLTAATAAEAISGIPGQTFNSLSNARFQYLEFLPTSVAAVTNGGAGCCGANNYGLNELRLFVTPEPGSFLLMGLGALAIGLVVRRRRRA